MKSKIKIFTLVLLVYPYTSFASPSVDPGRLLLGIGLSTAIIVGIGVGVRYLISDETEKPNSLNTKISPQKSEVYSFKFTPLVIRDSDYPEGLKLQFSYSF